MTRKRFIKLLMGRGASKRRAQAAAAALPTRASYAWFMTNGGMTIALAKWYGIEFDPPLGANDDPGTYCADHEYHTQLTPLGEWYFGGHQQGFEFRLVTEQ